MLLMFPTQHSPGLIQMGHMAGCWCWRVTLGDRETARSDTFSLPELNASRARGSNHSVNSLPGPPASCGSTQGSVVSWAESFETLLQDRVAVTYFTVSVTAQSSAPAPSTLGHRLSHRHSATRPADLSALQEFLKKEFSAENVYFWQACERFQQIPASDTQQVPALGSFAHSCWEGCGQSCPAAHPGVLADPFSEGLSRLGALAEGIRRWM